jgi:hypothetical protein
MFEEEDRVADQLLLPGGDELPLDRHGFRVGDATEMEKVDVHDKSVRSL